MPTQSRYRCVATLRSHTTGARACVLSNKASEQSGAQVKCVAALSNGRVVSGSWDRTLMVWGASSELPPDAELRDVDKIEPRVDCSSTPRRAQVLCVAALPNGRVVSGSGDRHAQGGISEFMPPDTMASAGRRLVEQRVDASPSTRRAQVMCVADPTEPHRRVRIGRHYRSRCGTYPRGQCIDADRAHEGRGAGVQSNRASTPRLTTGGRSFASPSCRTAASCPGRTTARSRCGRVER